jgi:hypothetical protein
MLEQKQKPRPPVVIWIKDFTASGVSVVNEVVCKYTINNDIASPINDNAVVLK